MRKNGSGRFSSRVFFAHIPTLSLTTHGEGIEGARTAVYDLIKLWIEEKIANGEEMLAPSEQLYSTFCIYIKIRTKS